MKAVTTNVRAGESFGCEASSAGSDDADGKDFEAPSTEIRPTNARYKGVYDPAVVGHPARIAYPIVAAVLLFSLGSNMLSSSISPLKSTLRKELRISNAQYATLDTADSLINTILPIISGIAVDYYGPTTGAVYSSVLVLVGAILTSVAASKNSFPLFLGGQILFGFGSTTIETTQNKLYSFYCLGGGFLGLVYGLNIGIGRVWNLLGRLTAVPISQNTGNYAWTFWVGTIVCGVTLALCVVVFLYEQTLPGSSRVPTGRQIAMAKVLRTSPAEDKADIRFTALWRSERRFFLQSLLAIPACFWILDASQFLQNGAVNAYTSNLADVVRVTRNATTEAAGYTSALGQVMPIVLTPMLGFAFDRWGKRMHWVVWTSGLWILAWSLLAYSKVHALVPILLGSLALATNVLPWIASIPLLVPDQANLGTAFGVYKALNNCASVIVTTAAGAIQDGVKPDRHQYDFVFAFIIAIKALDFFYGIGYYFFDRKYLLGVLSASDKRQRKLAADIPLETRQAGLRKPRRSVTVAGLTFVGIAIIVTLVLFWFYSV